MKSQALSPGRLSIEYDCMYDKKIRDLRDGRGLADGVTQRGNKGRRLLCRLPRGGLWLVHQRTATTF